jgi:hypothetical protein
MELACSLLCPQKPSPAPVLNKINTVHAILSRYFKTDFNIIFPRGVKFSEKFWGEIGVQFDQICSLCIQAFYVLLTVHLDTSV